jgi:DNA helicase-2/ATP-dependent DNA helicase PcrA
LLKKAVKSVIPPKKQDDDEGFLAKKNTKEAPVYFAKKISEIKNLGEGGIEEPRMTVDKRAQIMRVYETYEASLQRNNAFDFDDLIEKVVVLFRKNPEVLLKYQNMFDAILVDEYQDINPQQYALVSLLAQKHRNLSVVGDDEQTIYSWRYADIKTFLNFDKEWKGAAVHFLEENYRSTGVIIRSAAAVAKNNRFRTPKNLWTQNPDGQLITLFEAWGENEEAEWIANEIKTLRNVDKNADIGIFYRTNAQSRAIEQALIRANIPYRIFGGLKFYERREIKDVVSALRFISNSKDEVAKERLEKNLTKRKFAAFNSKVQLTEKLDPLTAIKLFLETFGYFEYLELNFINSDEREENIAELVAFAAEFTSLDELLERLSLLQAADEIGNKKIDGREVNLMTIHLAKGLEFDSVFIAGVAEGFMPHGRSLDNEDSLEEERRLMYVAMTRARKKLYLSFHGIPSRFIGEIPAENITMAGSSGSSSSGRGSGYADNNDNYFWDGEENVVQFD